MWLQGRGKAGGEEPGTLQGEACEGREAGEVCVWGGVLGWGQARGDEAGILHRAGHMKAGEVHGVNHEAPNQHPHQGPTSSLGPKPAPTPRHRPQNAF